MNSQRFIWFYISILNCFFSYSAFSFSLLLEAEVDPSIELKFALTRDAFLGEDPILQAILHPNSNYIQNLCSALILLQYPISYEFISSFALLHRTINNRQPKTIKDFMFLIISIKNFDMTNAKKLFESPSVLRHMKHLVGFLNTEGSAEL
jgi:hypothetical protein